MCMELMLAFPGVRFLNTVPVMSTSPVSHRTAKDLLASELGSLAVLVSERALTQSHSAHLLGVGTGAGSSPQAGLLHIHWDSPGTQVGTVGVPDASLRVLKSESTPPSSPLGHCHAPIVMRSGTLAFCFP